MSILHSTQPELMLVFAVLPKKLLSQLWHDLNNLYDLHNIIITSPPQNGPTSAQQARISTPLQNGPTSAEQVHISSPLHNDTTIIVDDVTKTTNEPNDQSSEESQSSGDESSTISLGL